ncbi:MAG TPA: hypothetical protein VNX21_03120, partial [Candidatus Thermoplasmatota archaeon]|nr:hypothetical protein [Candidatus Thermoplasmatota archaeon]
LLRDPLDLRTGLFFIEAGVPINERVAPHLLRKLRRFGPHVSAAAVFGRRDAIVDLTVAPQEGRRPGHVLGEVLVRLTSEPLVGDDRATIARHVDAYWLEGWQVHADRAGRAAHAGCRAYVTVDLTESGSHDSLVAVALSAATKATLTRSARVYNRPGRSILDVRATDMAELRTFVLALQGKRELVRVTRTTVVMDDLAVADPVFVDVLALLRHPVVKGLAQRLARTQQGSLYVPGTMLRAMVNGTEVRAGRNEVLLSQPDVARVLEECNVRPRDPPIPGTKWADKCNTWAKREAAGDETLIQSPGGKHSFRVD